MNIRDTRNIHHAAGQKLESAKGDLQRILLIYLGITTALSLAASGLAVFLGDRIDQTGGLSNMGLRSVLSTAQTLLPIVQSVVLMALQIGYCAVAVSVYRGESFSSQTLFGGFRRFFPLLRAYLLQSMLYSGAVLLCIYLSAYIFLMLPSSAAFRELMVPLMESASSLSGTITLDEAALTAAADALRPSLWVFAALCVPVLLPMFYSFRLVTYRLVDHTHPRAMAALRESRLLMRRNRLAMLKLDLSLWWYYALQLLVILICYGDVVLALFGITLPISGNAAYFLFLVLSLAVQFVAFYFTMNRVAVTYAAAYDTLVDMLRTKLQTPPPQPPASAKHPWQDQYDAENP